MSLGAAVHFTSRRRTLQTKPSQPVKRSLDELTDKQGVESFDLDCSVNARSGLPATSRLCLSSTWRPLAFGGRP